AAALHVPAAMSTIGTIRRTSPAMKPIVWSWPKVHRARKPCHAASHRNGPVSSRIAGRQLAGKRSANDSNIESPSGGVEVDEKQLKRRGEGTAVTLCSEPDESHRASETRQFADVPRVTSGRHARQGRRVGRSIGMTNSRWIT